MPTDLEWWAEAPATGMGLEAAERDRGWVLTEVARNHWG